MKRLVKICIGGLLTLGFLVAVATSSHAEVSHRIVGAWTYMPYATHGQFWVDRYGNLWETTDYQPATWDFAGRPSGSPISGGLAPSYSVEWKYFGVWMTAQNNHLYVRHWSAQRLGWMWRDAGLPPCGAAVGSPGAPRRIMFGSRYLGAVVRCVDGRVAEYQWSGSRWQWIDRGRPRAFVDIVSDMSATASTNHKVAVARGSDGNLWLLDLETGAWTNLGAPPASMNGVPGITTTDQDYLYVFVTTTTGDAWSGINWLPGRGRASWVNRGKPACSAGVAGSFVAETAYLGDMVAAVPCANVPAYARLIWSSRQHRWAWQTFVPPPGRSFDTAPYLSGYLSGQSPYVYAFIEWTHLNDGTVAQATSFVTTDDVLANWSVRVVGTVF